MEIFTELIGGRAVQWRLERDKRLRKIHLQIHPQAGVIIRAPLGASYSVVSKILEAKGAWLLESIDDTCRLSPRRDYTDGEVLPCLGREIQLEIVRHNQSNAVAHWKHDKITISLPASLAVDRDMVRECLMDLYMKRAKKWFPLRVDMLNKRYFGHQISRIAVKSQSSILGSCSTLGNLNFNWRLILAPVEVADYVIIHELAHFQEMNHSKKFWGIVESACPDYRVHRAWLRQRSAVLYI